MIKAFGNLFQPPKFEDPEQMRLANAFCRFVELAASST